MIQSFVHIEQIFSKTGRNTLREYLRACSQAYSHVCVRIAHISYAQMEETNNFYEFFETRYERIDLLYERKEKN